MDPDRTVNEQRTLAERQAYESALSGVRRNVGCTKERLIQYPPLVQVLQRRLAQAGQPETVEACIGELKNLITGLSNPRHRDALLVALRFDPRFPQNSLTARRDAYKGYLAKSSDPESNALSVDSSRTLERRENRGIVELARYLTSDKIPLHEPRDPAKVGTDTTGAPEPTTTAISFTYRFSETGAIVRQDVTRWLTASGQHTSRLATCSHQYYADSRSGVLECHADFGCRILDRFDTDDGGVLETFELPKQLDPGDPPYPIGYHVIIHSDIRCKPIVRWLPGTNSSQHTISQHAEFRLTFHPAMRPSHAWWFAASREAEAHREPHEDEGRHLEILDNGESIYIYKSFDGRPLAHGLYGVRWTWMES
jgi:hypothetical protein